MKMLTLNWTDRARGAATLIGKMCGESHRGASRYWGGVRPGTFGVVLYGNDGYAKRPESDPVLHARHREYVHNLYAGLANLLPEGDVEFGTDEGGYSWVILAMFPMPSDHGDNQDQDEDDDSDDEDEDERVETVVDFWRDIVWEQWKSQVAFTEE